MGVCGLALAAGLLATAAGAVLPPPWADPNINPCSSWQELFWPENQKCYRIFSQGPCPETQELAPGIAGGRPVCRCPPGLAFSARDARCHRIFQAGPCNHGEYFAPVPPSAEEKPNGQRWGTCLEVPECEENQGWHPETNQCFGLLTRGPCPKGELLVISKERGGGKLAVCECSDKREELRDRFWPPTGTCHEYYTRGPCLDLGHLFLPGAKCNCHKHLDHYHEATGKCYPLGEQGPCPAGHRFSASVNATRGECQCKVGLVLWPEDGACYRAYTRGPCPAGQVISVGLNKELSCQMVPCRAGRLFFPEESTCYRVGTRGPCRKGHVVVFEAGARPSVEGVSYRGHCGPREPSSSNISGRHSGAIKASEEDRKLVTGKVCPSGGRPGPCHPLYSQGPCPDGQWLAPLHRHRQPRAATAATIIATCQCRPPYRAVETNHSGFVQCQPPVIELAEYLNANGVGASASSASDNV